MKLLIAILSSTFVILISAVTSNAQPESAAIQSYYDDLKNRNYNPEIAPEGNDGHGSPIHIYSTMYLLDVHKIDDSNMDYRASFYFRQSWNDTRLAFPELDISSILMANTDRIWTPDLFFIQEKEGIHHNIITPNVFVRIQPDGEVKYSVRVSITFSCPMDFRKYPHDTQKCSFKIESYGRHREELKLDWDPRSKEPVSKTDEINVLPFELTAIENSAHDITLSSGNNYRALEITLTFKRKIGFFMIRLYIPFIILVAVSWLSFWIKCKMVALRSSLLLAIMYLMINISSDISSSIPPAPYTKASDVWIAVCESLVFAAFLELIFVSILSRSEKKFERCSSSTDAEAPIIGDADEKEKSVHSMSSAIRKVASRLSKENKISNRVDTMASILFPLLFLLFNFLYWLIY